MVLEVAAARVEGEQSEESRNVNISRIEAKSLLVSVARAALTVR